MEPNHARSGFRSREMRFDFLCVGVIFLIALSIRVIHTVLADPPPQNDVERYIFIAQSLLDLDWKHFINYHYPPLFPVLIVLFKPFSPDYESASRAVSIAFSALSVIPLYLLAMRVFNRRTAVVAIVLFSLRFFDKTAVVQGEQVVIFFILVSILLGLIALQRRSLIWFGAAGASFGLAFLAKPEAWAYFLFLLGCVGLYDLWILVGHRLPIIGGAGPGADKKAASSATVKKGGGKSGKAAQSSGGKKESKKAKKDKPTPEPVVLTRPPFEWRRSSLVFIPLLLAGYFAISGPYLISYYRDTGRFTFNPKANSLFLVHNVLYSKGLLYSIQRDQDGLFTWAQRIHLEGDRHPSDFSLGSFINKNRSQFFSLYWKRFVESFHRNLINFFLRSIAPWVWPILIIAGLWPVRDLGRQSRALYFHGFALIPLMLVPMFSSGFERFYWTMIPWFMVVMARGLDRLLELVEGGLRKKQMNLPLALIGPAAMALVFILLGIGAGAEILKAKPDLAYWEGVEARRRAALKVRELLPAKCRVMSQLENQSIWRLAGFPPERQEVLPVNEIDQVIAYGKEKKGKLLVFHQGPYSGRYQRLAPLLNPNYKSPHLRLVYREQTADDIYVIYELPEVNCE